MNFELPAALAFDRTARKSVATQRVLVLTHSHPRLTRGGAEIAADALVQGLRAHFDVEAFLLACSHKPATERLGLRLTQPFADDEFLYQASPAFDHFKFANRDAKFPKILTDLLCELKPDIAHFHHYTAFGVEAFAIAKRARPELKIVLTLHEFLAICHNHGQMVKTKSLQLCEAESPTACSQCFPDLAARDFFLRKAYITAFFQHVDLFISPSRFLADRYVTWGLPKEKVMVLENVPPEPGAQEFRAEFFSNQAGGQSSLDALRPQTPPVGKKVGRGARRVRIGFFGQLSPLKGVLLLLEAARELTENDVRNLSIEIFGDYSNQPMDFQQAVVEALDKAGANVRYRGAYDNHQVHRLMRSMDAIVVPSLWWENSPVVIQEALTNGRPIICSDIGGMAEAVRPGLDGYWFSAGDSLSLAHVLIEIAQAPEILTRLAGTLRRPRSVEAVVAQHMDAYERLGDMERLRRNEEPQSAPLEEG